MEKLAIAEHVSKTPTLSTWRRYNAVLDYMQGDRGASSEGGSAHPDDTLGDGCEVPGHWIALSMESVASGNGWPLMHTVLTLKEL